MSKSNKKRLNENPKIKDDLYFYLFLIAIITFAAFLPSLYNGFTNWDDDMYVTDNWKIKALSWENMKYMFFQSTHYGGYEPLTEFSFALEYYFFKLNPSIYHLNNLLLHVINSLLVFWLIFLFSKRQDISFLSAILFSIHPLRVESVAWIAERKDVLLTLFFLLSLIAYIYYLNKKDAKFYLISVISFVLCLMPKAQILMFPFVLIATDYFFNKKISMKTLAQKMPYFLISAIFLYILLKGHIETRQIQNENSDAISQNILYANFALIFYLIKFIFPFNLSNCYPLPDKYWGQPMLTVYYIAPLLVIGLIILIYINRKNKKLVYVSLFYFLTLLIVLQLKRTGPAVVADRYTYVPFIGLSYLASDMFFVFFDKLKEKKFKITFISAAGIIILLLIFITWNRCLVWKNSYTLWTDAIKKFPDTYVAHNHMAIHYMQEKNVDMAIKHFNKTIEIEPKYFGPYNNLGIIYHDKKEYEKAIEYYNKGINLRPDSHMQYYNLAYAYHKLNKLDDAVFNYKKAIELRRDYTKAINNLARALMEQKKYIEAESYIKMAIKYNPDYPHAYITYGDLLIELKRYNEAEEYLNKVNKLIPDNPLARNKTAALYAAKKEYDKAIQILNGILDKDQKEIKANIQLAKIYKEMNNPEKYNFYLSKAEEIDPEDSDLLDLKKNK